MQEKYQKDTRQKLLDYIQANYNKHVLSDDNISSAAEASLVEVAKNYDRNLGVQRPEEEYLPFVRSIIKEYTTNDKPVTNGKMLGKGHLNNVDTWRNVTGTLSNFKW